METRGEKILIAYVAVPHAGYLNFFRQYAGSILYILGEEFTKKFPSLVRHLPGVTPEESKKMIEALGIFSEVYVLTHAMLDTVRRSEIVMPDEDVSHAFAQDLGVDAPVTFDGSWRLRWDWGTTQQKHRPKNERRISTDILDRELMSSALGVAQKSSDWWRQIGALLVSKKGKVLLVAFNQHLPSEQSAYCYGDPRSNFEPGQSIEFSVALHAEARIFAEADKHGICTKGCSLWVTTFPCPPCAYLCAFTGIERLYYADGYALVAGAEVLESKGVEIIRVEMGSFIP